MEERALERAKAKQEREEKKRQLEQQKMVSTLQWCGLLELSHLWQRVYYSNTFDLISAPTNEVWSKVESVTTIIVVVGRLCNLLHTVLSKILNQTRSWKIWVFLIQAEMLAKEEETRQQEAEERKQRVEAFKEKRRLEKQVSLSIDVIKDLEILDVMFDNLYDRAC